MIPSQIINNMKDMDYDLVLYQSLNEYNTDHSTITSADLLHVSNYSVLMFKQISYK